MSNNTLVLVHDSRRRPNVAQKGKRSRTRFVYTGRNVSMDDFFPEADRSLMLFNEPEPRSVQLDTSIDVVNDR